MKDRTKKLLLNIAMVATIVVMVVIAVVYVGNHKGWFENDSEKDTTESTSEEFVTIETTTEQVAPNYATTEGATEQSDTVEITEATTEATTEVTTETTTEATTEVTTETTTEVTTEEITTTESTLPSKSCTITIQCTTILSNMDKLKEGKEAYVPSSGYILSVTMDYTEGETVFDVLTRACSQYGVQLEYAYTPMYGSYYIEGINHLYEFDCGGTSGWKYSVNGSSPNYGCSNYTVCENDSIVWYYVCE